MPWALIIPLLTQYGIPFVVKIVEKIESGKDVTSADLAELDAIAGNTPQSHLAAVARHLGLALTDPKIVALAALIK